MLCGPCWAEDALVSGGKSPSGRYEVRIFKTDPGPESNYDYGVIDKSQKKLIKMLEDEGGFLNYENARQSSDIFWNSSSDVFALLDQSSRHSMDLYVYRIISSSVIRVSIPDYLGKALKMIGAKQGGVRNAVTVKKWTANALHCILEFDADINDGTRHLYETDVFLKYESITNRMIISSMTKPDQVDE
jgi:hypothetical protein